MSAGRSYGCSCGSSGENGSRSFYRGEMTTERCVGRKGGPVRRRPANPVRNGDGCPGQRGLGATPSRGEPFHCHPWNTFGCSLWRPHWIVLFFSPLVSLSSPKRAPEKLITFPVLSSTKVFALGVSAQTLVCIKFWGSCL